MKKFILLLSAIFFFSNLCVQGQETFKYLTHTTDSLVATVWNNGLIGDNAETGASGFISWNGINGIWGSCLVFGTRARGTANGGAWAGTGFWDMVNVSSNFAAGFSEETLGNVTFDQVSTTIISDDNATNPYGFDVIQKTYSLTGENVVFCRNGYVNSTEADVTDLYAGFGGDWEIGQTLANSGGIDTDYNLVYVYEPGSNKPYFGFATFDSLSGCKVWPNTFLNETQARNDAFTYISTIDQEYPSVGDQKSTVGSCIGDVAVGDTAWVTFAIVAGNDLGGIKANTARAFEIAKNAGWTDKITDVAENNSLSKSFKLAINYPNPFNPSTVISYSIPNVASDFSLSKVTLKIYDILGREVATLVNQKQKPGTYEINFNANYLSSGVYFYKLTAGNLVETKKMILLR